MDFSDVLEERLTAYIKSYLEYYQDTVDRDYSDLKLARDSIGATLKYSVLALYGKSFGKDVAANAFYSGKDLYVYFIPEEGKYYENITWAEGIEEFTSEPFIHKTLENQEKRIREYIQVGARFGKPVIGKLEQHGPILGNDVSILQNAGKDAGSFAAHRDAKIAKTVLDEFQTRSADLVKKIHFNNELIDLRSLRKGTISKQKRGKQFEQLFSEVLDYYGWNIKEIIKKGEQIDFTAVFEGNHIIGEAKWYAEPIGSSDMRNFITRLSPRPQSLGLFVSYSGFTKDSYEVLKENINKTIITFVKTEIDDIICKEIDPGMIFNRKLRERYDYIFKF